MRVVSCQYCSEKYIHKDGKVRINIWWFFLTFKLVLFIFGIVQKLYLIVQKNVSYVVRKGNLFSELHTIAIDEDEMRDALNALT